MARRPRPLFAAATALLLAAAGCASSPGSDASADRDAAIRDSIEQGMRRDPAIDRIPVQVRVEDGRVVLYGSVDTPEESQRVEQIARDAAGVESVENHLRVGAGSDPSDREIPIEALQGPSPGR